MISVQHWLHWSKDSIFDFDLFVIKRRGKTHEVFAPLINIENNFHYNLVVIQKDNFIHPLQIVFSFEKPGVRLLTVFVRYTL